MDKDVLLKRIQQYGADINGIENRFMGDMNLYTACFEELVDEPNFGALKIAIGKKDYTEAFEAAHALKGLSGNLGLTPLYKDICVLVESLRSQEHENLANEYDNVEKQYEKLKAFADK